ncbi:MAG: PQQ-binding-like beta-propeller repeat protein [Ktedonobacteraceae bacterium]|nr:PQQ-binding-like beta-propeller repeat protein [Ktedonobacteraceae bacterium]
MSEQDDLAQAETELDNTVKLPALKKKQLPYLKDNEQLPTSSHGISEIACTGVLLDKAVVAPLAIAEDVTIPLLHLSNDISEASTRHLPHGHEVTEPQKKVSLQPHTNNLLKRTHPLPFSSRRLVLLFVLAIIVVVASTGSVERQYVTARTVLVDMQGSVISVNLPNNLHQIQAFDQAGNEVWRTFVSEGTFSLPAIPTHPGTLLAVLSDEPYTYRHAPDDPAYAHQLGSLFTLVLLDRRTGKTLWQHIVVYPEQQRDAMVLAADKNFIYVASIQTVPSATNAGVQLLAVDQPTGNVDWRVFGSPEPSHVHDYGVLLLKAGQAIWRVAGTLYTIDTTLGQIEVRNSVWTYRK